MVPDLNVDWCYDRTLYGQNVQLQAALHDLSSFISVASA